MRIICMNGVLWKIIENNEEKKKIVLRYFKIFFLDFSLTTSQLKKEENFIGYTIFIFHLHIRLAEIFPVIFTIYYHQLWNFTYMEKIYNFSWQLFKHLWYDEKLIKINIL